SQTDHAKTVAWLEQKTLGYLAPRGNPKFKTVKDVPIQTVKDVPILDTFLARWGGDSRAAAPRKPGFGFLGRNAAKRTQKTSNDSVSVSRYNHKP
ncbi:MAG TPA: hypothetical protein VGH51_10835, partial [Candidatus Angelobacter sp.]